MTVAKRIDVKPGLIRLSSESHLRLTEANRLLIMAEQLARFGHWRVEPGERRIERSCQANRVAGVPLDRILTIREAWRRVHPEDRPALRRCLRAARLGRSDAACRIRLTGCDGAIRHVAVQAHIDRRGRDGAAGMFGVISDITPEVAAEQALIAARDAAEEATRAKSEFLATMSHEIRTPMTGVMGMIDLLCANPPQPERDQYLAAMKQSAQSLMAVLDGILDFSKVESGRIDLDCKDFDLEALARGMFIMFGNSASKKGIDFQLTIDPGASPIVRGDPLRIQQVMSNFINNAIKFTPSGRVTLAIRARPRRAGRQLWRVAISDTGIGLDEQAVGRLFEPFVQMGHGACGGTGLGLAISRRLIKAMGGRTGVRSKPGRGSTFWFELELPIGQQRELPEAAPKPDGEAETGSLHVLVAEDNPINRLLITAMVRSFGHRVTSADNGRRAAEAAEAVPFDCILMDMQMPEVDGLEATRRIRASGGGNATVPIIALTADAAPERRRHYDNVGLTDFMTKPIDSDALRRLLQAIAATRQAAPLPAPAGEIVCAQQIAELRRTIGDAKLVTLIGMLQVELQRRPPLLRRLARKDDLLALRSEAHGFKGAAANLGLMQLARAAKAVELALPGAELECALSRLDSEVASARRALTELLAPGRLSPFAAA